MRRRTLLSLVVPVVLLLLPAALAAQVGSSTDIITGTVRNATNQPVAGATITVTSVETGTSRSRTTNDKGQFTILFPDGGGNYRLVARAIGQQPVTLQVVKQADEDRLVANVRFTPAATQLSTVQIQGRQNPNRGAEQRPEPGNQERSLSGDQLRRLPVDPSDFASLASLSPGVVAVAGSDTASGGFSVAGQRADANQVTLDGLSFGSGSVPQEAVRNARVITSTYDIARGQFTGGQVASTTRGGTNDYAGSFSFQLRDPSLQQENDVSAGSGFTGAYTQLQLSGGLGGPIVRDNTFFFGALQLRRRTDPLQSLLTAGPRTLDALGVSPDSAARFLDILRRFNLPLRTGQIPADRVTDNGSVLVRFDHQLTQDHTLTIRGNWQGSVLDGFRISPQSIPTNGGEQQGNSGGALVSLSSVLGTFVNEFKGSYSRDFRGSDPYLAVPEGRVQVGSSLGTSGTRGLTALTFGGNNALPTQDDGSQLELTNELSWIKGTHRLKLGGLLNRQTFSTFGAGQRNGSFFFNSLADLEANRPASYTRSLTDRTRSGAGINSAVYFGDTWRRGPALQLTYGVRAEQSSFDGAPTLNPDVLATFGRRTSAFPSEVRVSPRVGFTWFVGAPAAPARRDTSRAGAGAGGPGGGRGGQGGGQGGFGGGFGGGGPGGQAFGQQWIVRGGIGEFRGRAPLNLFSSAIDATGLPSGQQQLVCVGGAVPAPDWASYLGNALGAPAQCLDGTGPTQLLSAARPNVTVFDPAFGAPRSWRGSLGLSKRFAQRYNASVDASYALGTNLSGVRDLNLDATPKFTLASEGGRPVFVPATTIIPTTGATTLAASRRVNRYGYVLDVQSGLRSRTTQLQATLGGSSFRQLLWNATYTWQRVTDQLSNGSSALGALGGAPTAGDPNVRFTTRSDLERRHQLFGNITWLFKPWLDMTAIIRLNSGSPYTPRVGGDINGDGLRNDAAFVFDPVRTADSALAAGMQRVLATAPAEARRCLAGQLGQVAGRNSCLAPWTYNVDLQFNIRPNLGKSIGRRLTIQASLVNPLAGADQLLHGRDNLKGWGQPQFADANLLFVRGFDGTTGRFLYAVNERFGNNALARSALRNPFQVALQAQFQVGPDRQRQQLESFVRGGNGTGFDLRTIFARVAPSPIGPILELRDTLKLTGAQATRLQAIDAALTSKNDALIAKVEKEVLGQARGGGDFGSLFPRLQPFFQEGRNNFLAAIDDAKKVLTPEQFAKLPDWIRNPSLRQGGPGGFGGGRPGGGGRPTP